MSAISRRLLVGALLVLLVIAGGCQPIQPVAENGRVQAGNGAESRPITDSVTLVESQPVTASEPLTTDVAAPVEGITATVTYTESTGGAAGEVPEQSANESDPALLANGLAVYRAQYCGVCHVLAAAETRGTFGPPHDGMGQIAVERIADTSYSGAATSPAAYIAESIVDPQAYIVPGYAGTAHRMPVYAHLDQASVDALVAFLLAQ